MEHEQSSFIGVIFAKESKEIRAIVNPAYDLDLFDKAFTTPADGEERGILILDRDNFPIFANNDSIYRILERAKKILKEP